MFLNVVREIQGGFLIVKILPRLSRCQLICSQCKDQVGIGQYSGCRREGAADKPVNEVGT